MAPINGCMLKLVSVDQIPDGSYGLPWEALTHDISERKSTHLSNEKNDEQLQQLKALERKFDLEWKYLILIFS